MAGTVSSVLVVDDHPASRQLLVATLEACDLAADPVQARTFAEARDALEARAFDLVLLDLRLPDGDGLDILRWIRAEEGRKHCRVVVLTAGDSAAWEEAARLGADAYFIKPLNMEVLEGLLQNLGERRRLDRIVRHRQDRRVPDPRDRLQ